MQDSDVTNRGEHGLGRVATPTGLNWPPFLTSILFIGRLEHYEVK